MYTSGFFAWVTRAVRVVTRSNSNGPHTISDAHISEVKSIEGEVGVAVMVLVEDDITEVPMDKNLDSKKVSVVPFDPRECMNDKRID